jgi:hypothetical protein
MAIHIYILILFFKMFFIEIKENGKCMKIGVAKRASPPHLDSARLNPSKSGTSRANLGGRV